MNHELEDGVSHCAVVQRSRTPPSLKGWLQLGKEMAEVMIASHCTDNSTSLLNMR